MMKKIISLILMLAMLINVSAFAEEFSLHNGIKFGMTKDEVIKTELEAGFGLAEGRYGEGIIAGYNGAVRCEYYGIGSTLDKVCYFYYTTNAQSYTALGNALAGKYGAPAHTSNSGTYYAVENEMQINGIIGIADKYTRLPMTGQSIHDVGTIYERPGNFCDNAFVFKCPQYEQWLVPQEDGSAVLIDHSQIASYEGSWDRDKQDLMGDWNIYSYELITYTLLSSTEAAALQQNTASIYDDL